MVTCQQALGRVSWIATILSCSCQGEGDESNLYSKFDCKGGQSAEFLKEAEVTHRTFIPSSSLLMPAFVLDPIVLHP